MPIGLAWGFAVACANPALAITSITYRIAFDRGIAPFPAAVTVLENGPGPGDVTAPFAVTDGTGTLSLAGTLQGFHDPTIAAVQRQLTITSLTANIAPGVITPVGAPNHTIEIFACYELTFPYQVGPPHFFGKELDGNFNVVAPGAAPIDFARIETEWYDFTTAGVCATFVPAGGGPFTTFATALSAPPVLFGDPTHIDFQGAFASTTYAIGQYIRFTVRQDGDAVVMPNSSIGDSRTQAPVPVGAPTLTPAMGIVMVLMLLASGYWLLVYRRGTSQA